MASHEEILGKVQGILVEALGADDDEVMSEATLVGDLGAESIDFLDIVFQLEKEFSSDGAPFKINTGELFPEGLTDNPDWVQDGTITDAGIAMLKERMGHVNFDGFDGTLNKVGDLITVESLVIFVERKLQAGAAA